MRYYCHACQTEYPERVGWCLVCLRDGTVVPALRRRHAAIDAEPQTATARELAAHAWTLVEIDACPGLRVLRGALVLLTGAPGAGKSTLALRMIAGMRGPVVAYLAEERLGPAVGERLARLHIRRDDVHLFGRGGVDDLVALCRRVRARGLLIDSVTVTTLLPQDTRHLLQRLALDCLIGVCQVTKDGSMAGANEWAHEADLVLRVEDGRWAVLKTRFQGDPPAGEVQDVGSLSQ